jgi:hypothetical protein
MAWASGSATDFIDMLRKVKRYAEGTIIPTGSPSGGFSAGVQVPIGSRWTTLANTLPGSGFATDGELYMQGPGSDPADEITIGFKSYRNAGNNIFGFQIRGMTAYNSALAFDLQPGVSPAACVALDDATFNFKVWVSARRIMVVAIVGSTPVLLHAGFLDIYGTRSQYPYPLLVAGSQKDTTTNFQVNNYSQSSLPDPGENAAWLRWVDGSWRAVRNYSGSSDQRSQAREGNADYLRVWPLRDPTSSNDNSAQQYAEESLLEQFAPTGVQISTSAVTARPLFPATIMDGNNPQLVGRISGLYVTPGLGLNTGDTITDAGVSPQQVYDVYSNTWRTEATDFYAVKRS